MKLRVFASLSEDINNGWVWLPESIVSERVVIRLRNLSNRKTVYCEALPVGKNFVKRYNGNKYTIKIRNPKSCAVLNEWYRKKLEIASTQTELELQVIKANNPYGHFRASLAHPQIVVRLSMELGIIGLVLGIISLWK